MTYEECVYDLLSYYDDDRESFAEDAKKLSDYYFSVTGFRLGFRLNKDKTDVETLIDEASHLNLSEGAQEIIDELNESKKLNAEKYKTEKIKIDFQGGECRLDPTKGCDYMLGVAKDPDGTTIELYAEYEAPDDLTEDEVDDFDHEAYPELKDEIIEQAAKMASRLKHWTSFHFKEKEHEEL